MVASFRVKLCSTLLENLLVFFLGDQPITGADGDIIAPIVQAPITNRVEISRLSEVEAHELSELINAGKLKNPLTLIDWQSIQPNALK
jgi:preprotein translocase subunit SecD